METQQKALLAALVSGTEPVRDIKIGHTHKCMGLALDQSIAVQHNISQFTSTLATPQTTVCLCTVVMQHPLLAPYHVAPYHAILCEIFLRNVLLGKEEISYGVRIMGLTHFLQGAPARPVNLASGLVNPRPLLTSDLGYLDVYDNGPGHRTPW